MGWTKEKSREYYLKNKTKIIEYQTQYRENFREKKLQAQRTSHQRAKVRGFTEEQIENRKASYKKYLNANKEKIKTSSRQRYADRDEQDIEIDKLSERARTLGKYGLTLEIYDHLIEEQGFLCIICRKTQNFGQHLCVDHCHNTGKIRGLLCNACNRALGLLKDDPIRLNKLLPYLQGRLTAKGEYISVIGGNFGYQ